MPLRIPRNTGGRRCTECGGELPLGWPKALCRRCSLRGALDLEQESPWPEATLLSTGQVVDGRFRLRGIIGQGAMGVVWLADDDELKKPVALKFLRPELQSDIKALAELRRESAWNSVAATGLVQPTDCHFAPWRSTLSRVAPVIRAWMLTGGNSRAGTAAGRAGAFLLAAGARV